MPKPLKSGWANIVKKSHSNGSQPSGMASPPAPASLIPDADSSASISTAVAPASTQTASEKSVSEATSASALHISAPAAPASAVQMSTSVTSHPLDIVAIAASADTPAGSSPPASTTGAKAVQASPRKAPAAAVAPSDSMTEVISHLLSSQTIQHKSLLSSRASPPPFIRNYSLSITVLNSTSTVWNYELNYCNHRLQANNAKDVDVGSEKSVKVVAADSAPPAKAAAPEKPAWGMVRHILESIQTREIRPWVLCCRHPRAPSK